MNIFALSVGLVIVVCIIVKFKKSGYETGSIAYPILLATFPAYYWLFALFEQNVEALLYELIAGVFFLTLAALAYKRRSALSLIFLSIGFIGHGVYDILHKELYDASVAPNWWPEFCGSIDIILGAYIVWILMRDHYQPARA